MTKLPVVFCGEFQTWIPMAVPRKGVPPYREADRAMEAVSTAAHPRPAMPPKTNKIKKISQISWANKQLRACCKGIFERLARGVKLLADTQKQQHGQLQQGTLRTNMKRVTVLPVRQMRTHYCAQDEACSGEDLLVVDLRDKAEQSCAGAHLAPACCHVILNLNYSLRKRYKHICSNSSSLT